jgi:hypothetical protein
MVKQASLQWNRLRRYLIADPGRFAGGSAVSDPLGLLAIERERLAAPNGPMTLATVRDRDGLLILPTPGSIARPGPG